MLKQLTSSLNNSIDELTLSSIKQFIDYLNNSKNQSITQIFDKMNSLNINSFHFSGIYHKEYVEALTKNGLLSLKIQYEDNVKNNILLNLQSQIIEIQKNNILLQEKIKNLENKIQSSKIFNNYSSIQYKIYFK